MSISVSCRVMTFDPGYSAMGWAVGEDNTLLDYGTLYFKERDRLREIYSKVNALIKEHSPNKLLVEDFRVYREEIRGKHKTAFVIGLLSAIAYENGVDIELVNHNRWKAEFKRVYGSVWLRLNPEWEEGLRGGSEHSRDAVMMLLPEIVDLKRLLTGGKRNV